MVAGCLVSFKYGWDCIILVMIPMHPSNVSSSSCSVIGMDKCRQLVWVHLMRTSDILRDLPGATTPHLASASFLFIIRFLYFHLALSEVIIKSCQLQLGHIKSSVVTFISFAFFLSFLVDFHGYCGYLPNCGGHISSILFFT